MFFSFFVCVFVGLPGRDSLTSAPYKCRGGYCKTATYRKQTATYRKQSANIGKAATRSNSCNTLPNLTLWRSGRTHALPCSAITPAASHHSHPHRAPYPAQPPAATIPSHGHSTNVLLAGDQPAPAFLAGSVRVDHPETRHCLVDIV